VTRHQLPLRISRRAEFELESQFLWYELERRGLGAEFLSEVESCWSRIRTTPTLYASWTGDIRRAQVRRFPFTVFFSIEPRSIAILAVVHGRRHPRLWPRRPG
jgi:plasmid stabilization system protein ParE